jgi:hypothetical protein
MPYRPRLVLPRLFETLWERWLGFLLGARQLSYWNQESLVFEFLQSRQSPAGMRWDWETNCRDCGERLVIATDKPAWPDEPQICGQCEMVPRKGRGKKRA